MSALFVYGLKAPQGEVIRYVGKSANPLKRRAAHCSRSAAKALRQWVAELGTDPEVVVLERCATEDEACVAEYRWLTRLQRSGSLLNVRIGQDVPRTKRAPLFAGFGGRVVARRKSLGIQQNELAAAVGVNAGTISRLESSDRGRASAELAVLIARTLDCSVEWLVIGEPKPQVAE